VAVGAGNIMLPIDYKTNYFINIYNEIEIKLKVKGIWFIKTYCFWGC